MSRTLKVKSKVERLDVLFSKISGYQSTRTLKPTRSLQFSINSFKSGNSELDFFDDLMLTKTKVIKEGKEFITEKIEKTREQVIQEKKRTLKSSFYNSGKDKLVKNCGKCGKKNIFSHPVERKTQFGHRDQGFGKNNKMLSSKRTQKKSLHLMSNDFNSPNVMQSPQSFKFFREPNVSKHIHRFSRQRSENSISSEMVLKKYLKKVVKLKSNIKIMLT